MLQGIETADKAIDQVARIAVRRPAKCDPEAWRVQMRGSEFWEDVPLELGQYLHRQAVKRPGTWSAFTFRPVRESDTRNCKWQTYFVGDQPAEDDGYRHRDDAAAIALLESLPVSAGRGMLWDEELAQTQEDEAPPAAPDQAPCNALGDRLLMDKRYEGEKICICDTVEDVDGGLARCRKHGRQLMMLLKPNGGQVLLYRCPEHAAALRATFPQPAAEQPAEEVCARTPERARRPLQPRIRSSHEVWQDTHRNLRRRRSSGVLTEEMMAAALAEVHRDLAHLTPRPASDNVELGAALRQMRLNVRDQRQEERS